MTPTKPSAREQALKLIQRQIVASVKCYRAHNEPSRLDPVRAAEAEYKAASDLFRAITGETASMAEMETIL